MAPTPIFAGKRPLYQVVAEALLASIERGEFPLGSTLPTEAKISEQFGVSRHTVREALRSLSSMGLVESQHGIGTQVTSNRVAERYVQSLKSITDLWQYVKDTHRRFISISDVTPPDVNAPLPGNPEQKWRMLEGLRYKEGRDPVAWTQVFLLPKYADVFEEIQEEVLIYSLVERRHGLITQSVRQTITAVEIDEHVAKLVHVKPGSGGLAILREYISSTGEIYEVTWSIHPASRYKYSMEITLSYGAN
jgi:GntR family transcriptional regulator